MNYEVVNFCEFDKYAEKSYCAIHGEDKRKNIGDILKVEANTIKDCDMIVGGSPCQTFSIAGSQEGAKWECRHCGFEYNPLQLHYTKRNLCPYCGSSNIDTITTSSLIIEYLRVVREKRPKVLIFENVKNLIGKKFKMTFDLFLTELNEYGYNTYWKVLNAKDYGVPQNRERIFVIGILKSYSTNIFKFPEPFNLKYTMKDFLDVNVDFKYYMKNWKAKVMIEKLIAEGRLNTEDIMCGKVCNCITARHDRGISNRKQEGTAVIVMQKEIVPKSGILQIGNIFDSSTGRNNPSRGRLYNINGVSPTLSCASGGGLSPYILDYKLPNHFYEKNINEYSVIHIINQVRYRVFIRKITPLECFRLMGFSDIDFYNAQSQGVSDTQLYKQAGNSIVVDVVYYILLSLYQTVPDLFDNLKVCSLFSGIGAFESALQKLYKIL